MSSPFLAEKMKAWQYTTSYGGIEKTMTLNADAPVPKRKSNQHLVKVYVASLNPVDYKPAEVPYIGRILTGSPATPGCEFAGRIVELADGSPLQPGQAVFGAVGSLPFAGGALAEYALAEKESIIALPEGISMVDAAGVPVVGWTAYQAMVQHVKAGDKVFINGGSGGTGIFAIQLAKTLGCHVTTTCSGGNVALCKSIGADEVINYREQNVLEALKAQGPSFAHVVDNAGADTKLFWNCEQYTKVGAKYVWVAGSPSIRALWDSLMMRTLPPILGGSKRGFLTIFAQPRPSELQEIGTWMQQGKIRMVTDGEFAFEKAPAAITKLKTGRARGKIVVRVVPESDD